MSEHCCDLMDHYLGDTETAIVYLNKFREYGVPVLDGGSSFICIEFCPWCGKKLPASLRDEWFALLEKRAIDPDDLKIPAEYLTDRWWKDPKGFNYDERLDSEHEHGGRRIPV